MSEERVMKLLNYKHFNLLAAVVIVWSFGFYWIGVSGWGVFTVYKACLLASPFVICVTRTVVKYVSSCIKARRKQQAIILSSRIRRIVDRVV